VIDGKAEQSRAGNLGFEFDTTAIRNRNGGVGAGD
jgi:hypothetical protein